LKRGTNKTKALKQSQCIQIKQAEGNTPLRGKSGKIIGKGGSRGPMKRFFVVREKEGRRDFITHQKRPAKKTVHSLKKSKRYHREKEKRARHNNTEEDEDMVLLSRRGNPRGGKGVGGATAWGEGKK